MSSHYNNSVGLILTSSICLLEKSERNGGNKKYRARAAPRLRQPMMKHEGDRQSQQHALFLHRLFPLRLSNSSIVELLCIHCAVAVINQGAWSHISLF